MLSSEFFIYYEYFIEYVICKCFSPSGYNSWVKARSQKLGLYPTEQTSDEIQCNFSCFSAYGL